MRVRGAGREPGAPQLPLGAAGTVSGEGEAASGDLQPREAMVFPGGHRVGVRATLVLPPCLPQSPAPAWDGAARVLGRWHRQEGADGRCGLGCLKLLCLASLSLLREVSWPLCPRPSVWVRAAGPAGRSLGFLWRSRVRLLPFLLSHCNYHPPCNRNKICTRRSAKPALPSLSSLETPGWQGAAPPLGCPCPCSSRRWRGSAQCPRDCEGAGREGSQRQVLRRARQAATAPCLAVTQRR